MSQVPIDPITGERLSVKDCWPQFRTERRIDKEHFRMTGERRMADVEMVAIFIPGDKHTQWNGVVTDEIRERFAGPYAAFKKGQGSRVDGTSLEMVPGLTESQIGHLKYNHVMTAEQLAELSDAGMANIGMGARDMVNLAKKFMAASQDKALAAKNMALEQQMQVLKERLATLEAHSQQQTEAEANPGETLVPAGVRRGRPPKVRDNEAA